MSDDLTWDLPTRLEEGRTNGSHLRWQVTPIHKEAAATIRQQQETIERLRTALEQIATHRYDSRAGWGVEDWERFWFNLYLQHKDKARAALENTND